MKGKIVKKLNIFLSILFAGALLGTPFFTPTTARSQESEYQIPKGVYIELTKEFYDALKESNSTGTKVYTNNPSTEYLKQIAVSTRFIVETNFQILKQQERMIELLQSLQAKKLK